MRFIYTTVKETVSTSVRCREGGGEGSGLEPGEDGNGKGKSHVKLYLDHDSGSLENHPLASSSSSSLKAQLL